MNGLGKLNKFCKMSETSQSRTRSFENFRVAVFGDDFRTVVEWASELLLRQWQYKCNQTYLSLVALTEDESQNFVTSAGNGNGGEAWRKMTKRWGPTAAERNRTLLKAIGPRRREAEDHWRPEVVCFRGYASQGARKSSRAQQEEG